MTRNLAARTGTCSRHILPAHRKLWPSTIGGPAPVSSKKISTPGLPTTVTRVSNPWHQRRGTRLGQSGRRTPAHERRGRARSILTPCDAWCCALASDGAPRTVPTRMALGIRPLGLLELEFAAMHPLCLVLLVLVARCAPSHPL